MNKDLQDLIDTADKLCANLDNMAQMDKKFCDDICIALENYSHQIYCMSEDIKQIQQVCGY